MTALWVVLIVIFLGTLIAGLPGAWKLHKMSPLEYALHRLTESFKTLHKQINRANDRLDRLARAIEEVK